MTGPQINIINNSDNDRLHIAIYQKPDGGGPQPTVAWRVISLCAGSTAYMPAPFRYAVQLRYDRGGASYRTRCVPIESYRGLYLATGEENCVKVTEITESGPGDGVAVKPDPSITFNVGACIILGGDPVFGPVGIYPNRIAVFRIRPQLFYAAKVEAGLDNGSFLDTEALAATEVEVRPNQTIVITGDSEAGYSLAVKEGLDTAECGS